MRKDSMYSKTSSMLYVAAIFSATIYKENNNT